jgi:hypothetical protein
VQSTPLDAHTIEAMVIAAIAHLLTITHQGQDPHAQLDPHTLPEETGPRERLRTAVLAGEEREFDQALELLFTMMQADAALVRGTAISQRLARELEEVAQLRSWIEQESHGRTDATRAQTPGLNTLLRRWFTKITLTVKPDCVVIAATRRGTPASQGPVEVEIDRAAWTRHVRPHQRQLIHGFWDKPEIIGALQAFADRHGRSPTWVDWAHAGPNHPQERTLYRHFKTWNHALRAARLQTVAAPVHYAWNHDEMTGALQAWTRKHGQPPTSTQWARAAPEHPSADTIRAHFGPWNQALEAAGLTPQPLANHRTAPWGEAEIIKALQQWAAAHGRPPNGRDWIRAAPGRPSANTLYKHFATWNNALTAAGLNK